MPTATDPPVIPMLNYADGLAALDWLVHAFGFREQARMVGDDGHLAHGDLAVDATGAGRIFLSSTPDYEGPRRHREHCAAAQAWSAVPWVVDGVLVYVDDVDAHYARAVAAGAVILTPPEDGFPARRYRCEDLEGHRWMFMQRSTP